MLLSVTQTTIVLIGKNWTRWRAAFGKHSSTQKRRKSQQFKFSLKIGNERKTIQRREEIVTSQNNKGRKQ